MSNNMSPDRDQRLADLHARLDAGEFTAAFTLDSDPSPEQLAAQRRDDFRLYAHAARVNHDPAVDFDAFVEELWMGRCLAVPARPRTGRRVGGTAAILGNHPEDPSVVVWGEPSRLHPELAASPAS